MIVTELKVQELKNLLNHYSDDTLVKLIWGGADSCGCYSRLCIGDDVVLKHKEDDSEDDE